jgi:hypothetical protein
MLVCLRKLIPGVYFDSVIVNMASCTTEKKDVCKNAFLNVKVPYKYEEKEITDILMSVMLLKKPCNKINQTNHYINGDAVLN